jgi:hypothetical protein
MTDAKTVTITKSISGNLGYSKGIVGGITGQFQYADATARGKNVLVKLDEGQCGYYTFVPIVREVW